MIALSPTTLPRAEQPRFTNSRNAAWFALHVHTNFERRVAGMLAEKGFECYVPLLQCRRQWSDRVKELEIPLFPGYVFCEMDVEIRMPVLVTPRVRGIVGSGKQPISIPDEELAMVRTVVSSGLLTGLHPYLQAGQKVLIERGPLAGVKGTLVDVKGSPRVVVSIDLLQRSIAAQVDATWVRPLA
jgi:transcription antitermination factor NusG